MKEKGLSSDVTGMSGGGKLSVSRYEAAMQDECTKELLQNAFQSNSTLLPVMRWKFDEFFFRWMALPDTVQYMQQIALKARLQIHILHFQSFMLHFQRKFVQVKNKEDASMVSWPCDDAVSTCSSTFSQYSASGGSVNGTLNPSSVGGNIANVSSLSGNLAIATTPTPPAIASPRNSAGRHGKKGSFSPRSSHSAAAQSQKVLCLFILSTFV